jgi:hypothetical protein
MLNRTNRTLSALALSNRLNLGTRSLAANASVNRGDQTLLVRQPNHGVMHDGMMWYHTFPAPKPGLVIPLIPGSFSQSSQCQLSCVTEQPDLVAVDVRVESEPRPAEPRRSTRTERPRLSADDTAGLKRTARRADHGSAAIRSATPGK